MNDKAGCSHDMVSYVPNTPDALLEDIEPTCVIPNKTYTPTHSTVKVTPSPAVSRVRFFGTVGTHYTHT